MSPRPTEQLDPLQEMIISRLSLAHSQMKVTPDSLSALLLNESARTLGSFEKQERLPPIGGLVLKTINVAA